jgi:hypothetical protein
MGFVGNPENPMEQPGIYCTELVELAGEIGITDLILGPGSVDVNVCVAGEGHILQSLPGPGSATAKAFPEGRPVGTIFWARAKTAGRSSVPGDLFKSPAGRTNDAGLSALIVQAI